MLAADQRAFSQWLSFLSKYDKGYGTVIMIQIENEVGMVESTRDYSEIANKYYKSNVPIDLMNYLEKMEEKWHEK